MVTLYRKAVIPLVTRSITDIDLSLHVGHNASQLLLLPYIWVDGKKKLYQYQKTLDDTSGERRGYMLIYEKPLDPFEYEEDYPISRRYILQNT